MSPYLYGLRCLERQGWGHGVEWECACLAYTRPRFSPHHCPASSLSHHSAIVMPLVLVVRMAVSAAAGAALLLCSVLLDLIPCTMQQEHGRVWMTLGKNWVFRVSFSFSIRTSTLNISQTQFQISNSKISFTHGENTPGWYCLYAFPYLIKPSEELCPTLSCVRISHVLIYLSGLNKWKFLA